MELVGEQQRMLSVVHSQYHGCWCPGDFRSQGISRHGIDSQSRNIPPPESEELRFVNKAPRNDRVYFRIMMPSYWYRKSCCGNKIVVGLSFSTVGFLTLVRCHTIHIIHPYLHWNGWGWGYYFTIYSDVSSIRTHKRSKKYLKVGCLSVCMALKFGTRGGLAAVLSKHLLNFRAIEKSSTYIDYLCMLARSGPVFCLLLGVS